VAIRLAIALLALTACGGRKLAMPGTGADGGGSPDAWSVPGADAGGDAVPQLHTPCRDLDPGADRVAAAAQRAGVFLVINELGVTVVEADSWRLRRTFAGHRGTLTAAALSPDGTVAASAGTDDVVRIWRTDDGREQARVDRPGHPVRVAFSPTGDLLAVVDQGGTIAAVDTRSGRVLWQETRAGSRPVSLAFAGSGSGVAIVVGDGGGFVRRAATTGAPLPVLEATMGASGPAAVSGDGTRLAFAAGTDIRVVQLSDGRALGPGVRATGRVTAVALSADGAQVFVGGEMGVAVHEVATGALIRPLPSGRIVTDLAVSADGTLLAAAAGQALFFRITDGELVQSLGQSGFTWSVAFASDGRLAFAGAGGPTQVWDVEQGQRQRLFARDLRGNQGTVAFSPAGALLINFETQATFWDVEQNRVLRQFSYDTTEQPDRSGSLRFSPDGAWLVGPGPSTAMATIRVWDATTGKLLRSWPGHGYAIHALAVSPRGDLVASAGAEAQGAEATRPLDVTVKLWDAATGAQLARFEGHERVITSVAFSPMGDRLLASDRGGLVRLWSVPDGRVVRDLATPPPPTGSLTVNLLGSSAAFSADGQWIASAGVDWTLTSGHSGDIAIWSAVDGTLKQRLTSLAEGNLGSIAWAPNGKSLVAGTRTGARVWCLEDEPRPGPNPDPNP
jgi:WD40 repeat protein